MTPIKQYIDEHYKGSLTEFSRAVKPRPVLVQQTSRWIKDGFAVTTEGRIMNPATTYYIPTGEDPHV